MEMHNWKPFILALFVIGVGFLVYFYAGSKGDHKAHWTYLGETGPDHWGDLSHNFSACKEGQKQSPINIPSTSPTNLKGIEFNYKDTPLRIINNGHTIQLNYEKGSSIRVGENTYDLLQGHFHSPSEHKIKGRSFDMVAHLVHKNNKEELAVVAVLFEKGKKNDFIETLWNNLPAEEGKENVLNSIKINVKSILPAKKHFYNYSGSLTTPPCSEGVNWNVLREPVQVSNEQIDRFTSIFKLSVRPVQPLNGRTLKSVN